MHSPKIRSNLQAILADIGSIMPDNNIEYLCQNHLSKDVTALAPQGTPKARVYTSNCSHRVSGCRLP